MLALVLALSSARTEALVGGLARTARRTVLSASTQEASAAHAYLDERGVLADASGRALREWIFENDTTRLETLELFANIYEKVREPRKQRAVEATLKARTFVADAKLKEFVADPAHQPTLRKLVYDLVDNDSSRRPPSVCLEGERASALGDYVQQTNVLEYSPETATFSWFEPRYQRAAERLLDDPDASREYFGRDLIPPPAEDDDGSSSESDFEEDDERAP